MLLGLSQSKYNGGLKGLPFFTFAQRTRCAATILQQEISCGVGSVNRSCSDDRQGA